MRAHVVTTADRQWKTPIKGYGWFETIVKKFIHPDPDPGAEERAEDNRAEQGLAAAIARAAKEDEYNGDLLAEMAKVAASKRPPVYPCAADQEMEFRRRRKADGRPLSPEEIVARDQVLADLERDLAHRRWEAGGKGRRPGDDATDGPNRA